MSFLDLFRQEYLRGKAVDKYSLKNGNIGLIIDDYGTQKRYHVEFRDGYKGPSAENLSGTVKEPFSKKTEYLDKLIGKDDTVELTVSYSKGSFRQAYRLHTGSRNPSYKKRQNLNQTPYRLSIVLPYY